MLDALRSTAITLLGVPVSWGEAWGDLTGALCVWLLVQRNVWNWPIGLVNNALFFALFWSAKLYADATLQIAFFALGVYGWWRWVAGSAGAVGLVVRCTRPGEWIGLSGAALTGTVGVAWLLATRTDSPAPVPDAAVMTLSLAATYGQAQRLVESWWVWIAVDVLSVPLYLSRGLYPTAALYFVFGCMCVSGLLAWQARLASQAELAP